MWHDPRISRPQSFVLKFSQKLPAYTRVYTVCLFTCLQVYHSPQTACLHPAVFSAADILTKEHLACLRINECIKYKLLSLTNKVLTTNQPQYLHNLISVQPCHNTRSSSTVTLARPPTRSSLKITNRSFQYAAPCL